MPKEQYIYTDDNDNQNHNAKHDKHVPRHFNLPFEYVASPANPFIPRSTTRRL